MKKTILTAGALLAPFAAFAQQSFNTSYISSIMGFIKQVLGWIIPVFITVLLIAFLWQLYKFITTQGAEEKKKAREGLIYNVVALFLALSIWGIVAILQKITGTQGVNVVDSNSIPTVNF